MDLAQHLRALRQSLHLSCTMLPCWRHGASSQCARMRDCIGLDSEPRTAVPTRLYHTQHNACVCAHAHGMAWHGVAWHGPRTAHSPPCSPAQAVAGRPPHQGHLVHAGTLSRRAWQHHASCIARRCQRPHQPASAAAAATGAALRARMAPSIKGARPSTLRRDAMRCEHRARCAAWQPHTVSMCGPKHSGAEGVGR